MTEILDLLCCPLCRTHLQRVEGSLRCENGHSFDLARSGYVNLLPPGKEKNARTGDERRMVKARVDFLSRGYYNPISETLAELLAEEAGGTTRVLCDMGCGEGYHTCRTSEKLAQLSGDPVRAVGFDASKYAAEWGSKRAKAAGFLPKEGIGAPFTGSCGVYFAPANLFHLPLHNHVCDAALSLFAPIGGEEARRILKPGGHLAVVSAGRDHLIEMRQQIYREVRLSDSVPPTPEGFRLKKRLPLTWTVSLSGRDEMESLFVMTPFYYKTTPEGKARLLSLGALSVTASVYYSIYEVL